VNTESPIAAPANTAHTHRIADPTLFHSLRARHSLAAQLDCSRR
jgi:hypothetical protein